MKLPKLKQGELVKVTFYDHHVTTGGHVELAETRAFGEVVRANKKELILAYWVVGKATGDDDDACVTIATDTIIKLRRYR